MHSDHRARHLAAVDHLVTKGLSLALAAWLPWTFEVEVPPYNYTRALRNRGPGVYALFLIFSYRMEVQTSTS
jgi:hypothetical protein